MSNSSTSGSPGQEHFETDDRPPAPGGILTGLSDGACESVLSQILSHRCRPEVAPEPLEDVAVRVGEVFAALNARHRRLVLAAMLKLTGRPGHAA